ncbi:hypothetical protein HDU81_004558 [Chytriomyces hyalinus]|nr:hypothetical protein HDU81_004558 [Chytriomyces hyalinus]
MAALSDVNAAMGVKYVGELSRIYLDSHALMHMIVGNNCGHSYKLVGYDLASDYVAKRLWEEHPVQMITNLQDMIWGDSYLLSRRQFALYGHRVISLGGMQLRCRNLQNNETSVLNLDSYNGDRALLGMDALLREMWILQYHEMSDRDKFPP